MILNKTKPKSSHLSLYSMYLSYTWIIQNKKIELYKLIENVIFMSKIWFYDNFNYQVHLFEKFTFIFCTSDQYSKK